MKEKVGNSGRMEERQKRKADGGKRKEARDRRGIDGRKLRAQSYGSLALAVHSHRHWLS